jgi:NADPH2:quinone reductase
VNNFCVGDRVAYMTGTMGTKDNNCYAEYTVFDSSSNITGVPDGIGLDQACASMVQGLTAHYLTTDAYKVKANNLVLIHGAGGGLGMILTQLCKRVGAKVIGTCSSPKKEQVARDNGCDFVINYLNNNFAEKVLSITNGHGVDVIYDGVGKTTFLSGFDALCKRGTMVLFGNACGEHPDPIEPTLLSQKGSITLIRPALYDYLLSQEEMHARCKELFLYMLDGTLQIPISATLDLCESIQAHNDLLHRKVSGKILFTIDSKVI